MDAFNADQKKAAEYLYQTAYDLRDALRDYHYASLALTGTTSQESLDEMRIEYGKAGAIEKNLVRFLSTPNTLPKSIVEAANAYRGAAVRAFQDIDSVRAGHHIGFNELEHDMVEEMKKLRALLDMGYVNGLPLPMPPP